MSRLTKDDWALAALQALGEQGTHGVAVEPIAARLGATKGSFYWHFGARDELLVAALELWERRSTTAVIERVEASGGTPRDRLRMLFGLVFDPGALTGGELALLSSLDDPEGRRIVERVTAQRIAYVTRLLRQAGVSPVAARRRAVLAYSAFLGHLQLRRHAGELMDDAVGAPSRYLDEILSVLLPKGA